MATPARIVREAVGAGRWFPGGRRELEGLVDAFIGAAEPPPITGRIASAIAPHAGFVYSGHVAGFTFRALRDAAREDPPDTVVVLGFSHREAFRGVALMDGDAISTPLGETPLDAASVRDLAAHPSGRLFADYTPHRGEHSAENEIPFLQRALPDAKLVIGLMGDHDAATIEALTAALAKLARSHRIVVVASSDMLHDPDYDLVTRTDQATLEAVARLDVAGVARRWSGRQQVFCGIAPVLTAMAFAAQAGCRSGTILSYRNSGDDHPESRGEWVVGYGAVAFFAP